MAEQIQITHLDDDGFGRGTVLRQDGQKRAVAVPYSLPGEVVEVMLRKWKKRGVSLGVIEKVVKPSDERVTPFCSHFTKCGGCTFQHMPQEAQLAMKEEKVRKLFPLESFSKAHFFPIIASPQSVAYRNKMEYSFSQTATGEKYLGLILGQTRGWVFNLEECHLVEPWFADTCKEVRLWWHESGLDAYFHGGDRGALRTLTLRQGMTSNDRMVMLTVSGNPDYALKKQQLEAFVSAVERSALPEKEGHLSIVLRVQQIAKGSPTQFYEMILKGPDYIREYITLQDRSGAEKTCEFQISPQAFFQPNTRTANILYKRALELAEVHAESVVYDLYCGIGVFGMCASLLAKKVIGIELSPESSYDAKTNSARLGLENFTIYKGDVGKVLEEKKQELLPPDIVILDPPRVGLDMRAIQEVSRLAPKTIVYVSCNPVTQSANVLSFVENGYELCVIQPVDQFPHTPHVENIAILKKRVDISE